MQTHTPSPSIPSILASSSKGWSTNGLMVRMAQLGSNEVRPFYHTRCVVLHEVVSPETCFSASFSPHELHFHLGVHAGLPGSHTLIDHDEHVHSNQTHGYGSIGTTVTKPVEYWNSLDLPVGITSQDVNDNQSNSMGSTGDTMMPFQGQHVPPNVGLTSFHEAADAAMAMDYPMPWAAASMNGNNPMATYDPGFDNSFQTMAGDSPSILIPGASHFAPPIPVLPGPVRAPRSPTLCAICPASFKRRSDYRRHVDSKHFGIKYPCSQTGCRNNGGNGFSRLDKLQAHLRTAHGFR